MFKKILIANRGEIALRVLRACKELGIETVCIYSKEDKEQLHVKLSDYAYCVGENSPTHSYLNINAIVTIAIKTGCDAVHPGYGFLSENANFAKILEENNIKFIGPNSKTIKLMGDKLQARNLMLKHNIPIVPGSDNISNFSEAKEFAKKIGYPILIKAAKGGGGKGMRKVFNENELENAFLSAKKESLEAFSSDELYIEKLILNPKHIEFQIIRDSFGNCIHLGERHCSIQRKNQKMLEEAPYKFMDDNLRKTMGDIAVKIANISNYENVGTIEFILDENNNFYFIEMNTRLQVEHPVTEMITGIDLVKEQLKIASKVRLNYTQQDINFDGHSIEIRLNSEDPLNNFFPSSGNIDFLFSLGGFNVRFDTYIYNGSNISPFYDSMLGKIIVKGKTRLEAIKKLRTTIENTIISGVKTNLSYQYSILHTKDFIKGDYDTNFIEKNHKEILKWINDIEEFND